MFFAIRDDDLNYFYNSKEIEKNYNGIWETCPISMSVVPFIKGDWPKQVAALEQRGPGKMSCEEIKKILSDNTIYPIGDNKGLVDFIRGKVTQKKVYLTIHGIHHRNEDKNIPQFDYNYGIGAEFFTTRDLTKNLADGIKYLETIFDTKISVFTPPQNLYNLSGIYAVINNNLSICGDFPAIKKWDSFKILGFKGYFNWFKHKISDRHCPYPYTLDGNNVKFINHIRLQPGSSIENIKKDITFIHKKNGVCVVSTHSYGFNYKMEKYNKTMGKTLREIIDYTESLGKVKFVNIGEIFE